MAPSAAPAVAAPDLGPLAWVYEELRLCLEQAAATVQQHVAENEAARHSDLAQVDNAELRLLGQQLHQAVGALELVDMAAPAQTLRALEAAMQRLVQKPALATPAAAQTVTQGCHALQDYLLRQLRQRPVPDLALFPTYRDWQQLAGAARIHPADLWRCEPRAANPPAGLALAAQPALRERLERLVLALLKAPNPAAATAAAQLAGALARGAGAGPWCQFWLAAAACFEALAVGRLPYSVWLKRSLSGLLSQYKLWSQGQEQGVAAATHDLLYLLAQVPPQAEEPAQAHWQAIWQAQGWEPPTPWDIESRVLGRCDPARLAQAQSALQAAQSAWERGTEAGAPPPDGALLQRLAQALAGLAEQANPANPAAQAQEPVADLPAATALQELAQGWFELARQAEAGAQSGAPGLALEVCHSLLLLGAELADFDLLDAQLGQRLQWLAQRLQGLSRGEPLPPIPPALAQRYRSQNERATLAALLAQMRGELAGVEQALAARWQGRRGADGQADAPATAAATAAVATAAAAAKGSAHEPDAALRRLDALIGVAALLELPAASATLQRLRTDLQAVWPAPGWPQPKAEQSEQTEPPPLERAAQSEPPANTAATRQRLGSNLSALGALLEAVLRQPERARSAFRFDPASGLLQADLPSAGAAIAAQALAVPQTAASSAEQAAAGALPAHEPAPSSPPEDAAAELLQVFAEEATALLQGIESTLLVLRQRPDSLADLTALRRAFHTLKGSARMVGRSDWGEAAWAIEQRLNTQLAERLPASAELLQQSEAVWRALQQRLPELFPVPTQAETASPSPVPVPRSPPTVGSVPVLRQTVRLPPLLEQPIKMIGPLRIELDLFNVFLAETEEWSSRLDAGVAAWAAGQPQAEPPPTELAVLAHSLTGAAATVGFDGLVQLARALEQGLERLAVTYAPQHEPAAPAPAQPATVLQEAAEQVRRLLHQFAAGFLREPSADTLAALATLGASGTAPAEAQSHAAIEQGAATQPDAEALANAATSVPTPVQPQPEPAVSRAPAPDDTAVHRLDADLWAVFEDEAQHLLPQLASALRQWRARPTHSGARAELLRHLHTLKGSARLAGALALGERAHRLEGQLLALPEPPAPEALHALQTALDQLCEHFEQLRRAAAAAASAPPSPTAGPSEAEPAPAWPHSPAVAPTAHPAAATLRVRADWLDRLQVHAADLSLGRTRLEADLGGMRRALQDMGSNVERLRHQLRELEWQTESQMQSRQLHSREADARFDPLELDRYTRVQELTRLLAESVNDVATVQHQLQRSLQAAEGNLAAQARQTREWQHDLLRSRWLAFDTLAERLQRSLRQAAEGCAKQAELQIENGAIEIERSVLERLAPVLEHLLRNAVVHGIEPEAERLRLGKPLPGRVRIELQTEGQDLAITLSDDGAGIDVERVRERALALGLHQPQAPWSAADAARLIFAVGLSTASALTEWAGRGVGLDAVRNEVLGLGGQIECLLPESGGCTLRLLLPRSSAVTEVLLLRVGDFVFGVPTPWVQQVRRARADELTAAYVSAQWRSASATMPFYWAGALLALSTESTDERSHQARNWPVLEFRSAAQAVAWHVDEVLGPQEVVLKPLGPQLACLPGLAGAAVLASGAVALIYNPVAVTAWCAQAARAWVRQQRAQAAPTALARRSAQAPLVLVVDDSITVRRLTQRLLQRAGYRVALAADGLQALDCLRAETPLLLLCDLEMPRMDGFELLRQLRQDVRWADLPVILITSRQADKHRALARELGVEHYLGKPYAEPELLALVQGYAAQASAARQTLTPAP